MFLAGGVLVLLTGDLMIFSWRYQLPGYVLLPLAGALGLTAVLGRRPAPPAPPDTSAAAAQPAEASATPG